MGSDRVTIYRITDYAQALSIVQHPVIKEEIKEDGPDDDRMPNIVDEYWLGAELDNKLIGCFRLVPSGRVCYQTHTMFIPGYRRHVIAAKNLVGKWCLEELEGFQKIYSMVPRCFQNVIKHALNIGFVEEGCLTGSYMKNGNLEDIIILGINRKQMEENI